MATDLATLETLARDALLTATRAYANGGSTDAWTAAMERAITRAHTAAFLAATADRLGVSVKTLKGLSRAERAQIAALVEKQLVYLDNYAARVRDGLLSDRQMTARSALYGAAARTTYSATRFPGLPFYPGEGSECKVNCRCEWRDNGDGSYTWRMGEAEHCPTCQRRAAGSPYQVSRG